MTSRKIAERKNPGFRAANYLIESVVVNRMKTSIKVFLRLQVIKLSCNDCCAKVFVTMYVNKTRAAEPFRGPNIREAGIVKIIEL